MRRRGPSCSTSWPAYQPLPSSRIQPRTSAERRVRRQGRGRRAVAPAPAVYVPAGRQTAGIPPPGLHIGKGESAGHLHGHGAGHVRAVAEVAGDSVPPAVSLATVAEPTREVTACLDGLEDHAAFDPQGDVAAGVPLVVWEAASIGGRVVAKFARPI